MVIYAVTFVLCLYAVLLAVVSTTGLAFTLPGRADGYGNQLSPSHSAPQTSNRTQMGKKPRLKTSVHQTFTLAILADLHYGEEPSGWGIDQDVKSTRVTRNVLGAELASRWGLQLAVIDGDLITGENTFRENASAYVDQVVAPVEEAGLPWASVYGNHDSKYNLSRLAVWGREQCHAGSLTRRMVLPDETDEAKVNEIGITNYYLLVGASPRLGRASTAGAPVMVLWFFDSRGGASYQSDAGLRDEDDIPNHVSPLVAAWFRTTRLKLQHEYGRLPSLAFVHIPPRVFLRAQEQGEGKFPPSGSKGGDKQVVDEGDDDNDGPAANPTTVKYPGINDDIPVAYQGTPAGHEDESFAKELLAAAPELKAVFVGHDHGNGWCSLWPGRTAGNAPFLCFGRHSGYGGYGTWERGARIVRVWWSGRGGDERGRWTGRRRRARGGEGPGEKVEVDTWVRMEDGSIIDKVSLNETYGLDIYGLA